jgi:hypothetical protein
MIVCNLGTFSTLMKVLRVLVNINNITLIRLGNRTNVRTRQQNEAG